MAAGFTKACSMGPVADAVTRAGGSLARIFRKADLPLRLIEAPEQIILLKDQLAVVEYAARELDDETLPLALSMQGGISGLGPFGQRVRAAPTLRAAIERCNFGICAMLQSATQMHLAESGGEAFWSYAIVDDAPVGRQKNELLAFGYMVETLRRFGAPAPLRAELPEWPAARSTLEDMLGCEIALGKTARLVFAREHLDRLNPACAPPDPGLAMDLPELADFVAGVEHLIGLGFLAGRPGVAEVSARLSLTPRTLQRRLAEAGTRFEAIRSRVFVERAQALLAQPARSVTEAALELGYGDPAHFSRAFMAVAGTSPRAWRKARLAGAPALATPAAKP
jgi:AraC-like DNA-binding protein